MKLNTLRLNRNLTGGALVLAVATAAIAQEKPYSQPGTAQSPPAAPAKPAATTAPAATPPQDGAVAKFFNGKLPEAIAKGKFSLNARLRYEYVDQDGVPAVTDDSHAPTIRTRFGYTTAPLYGFRGMLEGENVTVIGPDHNFNAAGANGVPYKPVVADPETTELNQAWLSYTYTNLLSVKAGRQRIALDNHRFIGDVGWRQNMQTFDAALIEGKPLDDLSLLYGYIWDVHRVFGDVDRLPAANQDFNSDSHFFNASYSGWKYGRVVGYTYVLDLENAAGSANSSATYGGYFAGTAPVTDKLSLGYRAEFAWQTDYANSPLNYEAEYYNLELSANVKPFSFGAGLEVLGTDSNSGPAGGQASFRTPLATLHAFNGWADVFLSTPAAGLQDFYAFAQVTLPQQIPLRLIYHKYEADSGGADFGQEFNVVASKKFGANWTTMLKYAYYDGEDAAPPAIGVPNMDMQKFWAQVEFNY
ncbi:MAG TPA: alginate export family protein [Methylomirabilota bacterium]|nr:alginate export family protein [Methylomirabilota bacterium]